MSYPIYIYNYFRYLLGKTFQGVLPGWFYDSIFIFTMKIGLLLKNKMNMGPITGLNSGIRIFSEGE